MSDALGFQIETKTEALVCLSGAGCSKRCVERCWYRDNDALEPWRQVLLDAADYIEAHGWAQGTRQCGEAVCAHGAIAMVLTGNACEACAGEVAVVDILIPFLQRRFPDEHIGSFGVGPWNNASNRTAAEVCAALRDCANS